MHQYVAGADGGGTKTMLEVRSLDGQLITREVFGALNINGQTAEQTAATLGGIVAALAQQPGGVKGCKVLCLATAGVSNPDAGRFLRQTLADLGYGGEVLLAGDQEAALHGAMGEGKGIILIAGTGSICYGKNEDGQSERSGGWGYLIDDEGSGYAIGRDILSSVVRAHDGRIAPTCLTEMVLDALQITQISQLIRFVYAPGTSKREVARLAPILSRGLEAGDEQCENIAHHAAQQLCALVIPVAKHLGLQAGQLALCGSVLVKNQHIAQLTRGMIHQVLPELSIATAKNDAAWGAAHMALTHARNMED